MQIQDAIEIENAYLAISDRQEADAFCFVERMEIAGYPDLGIYYQDKAKYQFENQFKPVIATSSQETVFNDIEATISDGQNTWYNVYTPKIWAYVGQNAEYDADYCQQHNIGVLPLGYTGGVIVAGPKDLNFVIVTKAKNCLAFVNQQVSAMLKNLNVENTINGNDIMIDGYKICGCAESTIGDYSVYFFQISFCVYPDLITAICKKPIVKIPKGINDFYPALIRDDLILEVEKWLR